MAHSSSSSSSDSSTIVQLYKSLRSLCTQVANNSLHQRNFATVDEQLDYLWFNYLPSLDHWYLNQFVPAIRQYEQYSRGKSATEGTKYKQLADLYGKTDELANKAFEYVNKAIRYSPSTEVDFLCNCYFFRSELHRYFANDLQSAADDMAKALHCRPKSFTCTKHLVDLQVQCNRPLEAFRVVDNSLKFYSTEMSASKIEKLTQMKESLALCFTLEETPTKEPSEGHHIQVDSRLAMARNENNRRFYFWAKQFINADEKLIVEQPSLFLLKRGGLLKYCSSCLKLCPSTFVPCLNCNEVIFCSENCLNASMTSEHQAECGIIGLLQREINAKAAQTYRLLAQSGHADLLAMSEATETFSPEHYFPEAQLKTDHETKKVAKWFKLAQCDLRTQVHHRSPSRTSEELASAIFLYALYLYKMKVKKLDSEKQVTKLIGILATDIAKVTLTQFGWHETVNQERQSIGSFQCLVGSHINHSCNENANWTYADGKLVIKSTVAIEAGQPVTIAYGSTDNCSFYGRQQMVQSFTVACNCPKCVHDVSNNFALRCQHCSSGPVPFDAIKKFTADVTLFCMRCERHYSNVAKTLDVIPQFWSTQRLIWLVQAINGQPELDAQNEYLLQEISNRMNHLAGYIFPHNAQWLHMIADICELFCARKWFEQAVSWLHWLDQRFGIYPTKDKSDEFTQLYELDLWTTAYTAYLTKDKAVAWLLDENLAKHTATVQKLFKQTFAILNKIDKRNDISHLVESKQAMFNALYRAVADKCRQFKKLIQNEMTIADELNKVLLEFEDDIGFLSFCKDRQNNDRSTAELTHDILDSDNSQIMDQSGEDGDEGDGK